MGETVGQGVQQLGRTVRSVDHQVGPGHESVGRLVARHGHPQHRPALGRQGVERAEGRQVAHVVAHEQHR
ncbi:MAG: hypothetical protein ACKO04_08200, partial [Actinomycetes bacterium]